MAASFSGVEALKMRSVDGTDIGAGAPHHAIGTID
jgi:hypothetical protein